MRPNPLKLSDIYIYTAFIFNDSFYPQSIFNGFCMILRAKNDNFLKRNASIDSSNGTKCMNTTSMSFSFKGLA